MREAPERIWRTTDHVHSNRKPGPEYFGPQEYVRADLVEAAREEGRQAGLREAIGATQAWTRPRDWGDTQEKRNWRNGAEYVGVKIAQDILALTNTPTPPDETGCQECGGGENPMWFAPHDLWNRVMGGEDCKDDPGGILCPVCFIRRAELAGIKEIWRVGPVEDNPPRSKGMTVQEAAIVVADWIDSDMITANELISAHVNITQETPVRHWFSQILRALSGDRHE